MNLFNFIYHPFWAWRNSRALRRIAIDYGLHLARVYAPGHTENEAAKVRAVVLYDDDGVLEQWAHWGCPGVEPASLRRGDE